MRSWSYNLPPWCRWSVCCGCGGRFVYWYLHVLVLIFPGWRLMSIQKTDVTTVRVFYWLDDLPWSQIRNENTPAILNTPAADGSTPAHPEQHFISPTVKSIYGVIEFSLISAHRMRNCGEHNIHSPFTPGSLPVMAESGILATHDAFALVNKVYYSKS